MADEAYNLQYEMRASKTTSTRQKGRYFVLEITVALVNALRALKKDMRRMSWLWRFGPPLKASRSPYAAELRARLEIRQD